MYISHPLLSPSQPISHYQQKALVERDDPELLILRTHILISPAALLHDTQCAAVNTRKSQVNLPHLTHLSTTNA